MLSACNYVYCSSIVLLFQKNSFVLKFALKLFHLSLLPLSKHLALLLLLSSLGPNNMNFCVNLYWFPFSTPCHLSTIHNENLQNHKFVIAFILNSSFCIHDNFCACDIIYKGHYLHFSKPFVYKFPSNCIFPCVANDTHILSPFHCFCQ